MMSRCVFTAYDKTKYSTVAELLCIISTVNKNNSIKPLENFTTPRLGWVLIVDVNLSPHSHG